MINALSHWKPPPFTQTNPILNLGILSTPSILRGVQGHFWDFKICFAPTLLLAFTFHRSKIFCSMLGIFPKWRKAKYIGISIHFWMQVIFNLKFWIRDIRVSVFMQKPSYSYSWYTFVEKWCSIFLNFHFWLRLPAKVAENVKKWNFLSLKVSK